MLFRPSERIFRLSGGQGAAGGEGCEPYIIFLLENAEQRTARHVQSSLKPLRFAIFSMQFVESDSCL